MRRILLWLLLPAIAPSAPPPNDAGAVPKFVSDLLPLKDAIAADEPLKYDVYTPAELQSVETYSQSQALRPFTTDLARLYFQDYLALHPRPGRLVSLPFIGPDQAYKLGTVLTGKELTEANLKPLVEGVVGMLESIDASQETSSALGDSTEFRASAEKVWNALKAFQVSNSDLRIVMESLFEGAENAKVEVPRLKYQ